MVSLASVLSPLGPSTYMQIHIHAKELGQAMEYRWE